MSLDIDPLTLADITGSPSALDLDLVKEHCNIEDTDWDTSLGIYIRAAVEWAEGQMHRTIFVRRHRWVLRDFPKGYEVIRLPRGKTQSIESVQYVNGGTTYTLTGPSDSPVGDDYQESLLGDDGGYIMPLRGQSWPSADSDAIAPVTITFRAGYTDTQVPPDIIHALLFAISDAYELKGTDDFTPGVVASGGRNFAAREALISPYRLSRWY